MQWLFLTWFTVYAEPDTVSENTESVDSSVGENVQSDQDLDAETTVEQQPQNSDGSKILNTQEITELLDQLKWDDVVRESLKLVDAEPENAKAYLTLGDALSRYPSVSGEGNIYKAYDVWTMAQSLTEDEELNETVEQRIEWAVENSGTVELNGRTQSLSVSENRLTYDDTFTLMLRSERPVDWMNRAERSPTSTKIVNIPIGKSVLKVSPSEDLPPLVYTVTLEPGEITELDIPLDEESMDKILQSGMLKDINSDNVFRLDQGGDYVLDSFIQKSIPNPEFNFEEFSDQMVTLPKAPIPSDAIVIFHGPEDSMRYDNGLKQTLPGGLYVVSVEKKGVVTYGDMVVHEDLTIKHIREFTLKDDLRRATVNNPNRVIKIKPRFNRNSKYTYGYDPDGRFDVDLQVDEAQKGKKKNRLSLSRIRGNKDGDIDAGSSGVGTDGLSGGNEDRERSAASQALLEKKQDKGQNVLEQLEKLSDEELQDIEPIMANYKRVGTVQRWALYGFIGAGSYSGVAFLRANSMARKANNERQSQRNFNQYQSRSQSWGQQYQVGLIASSALLASYLTSLYIDKKLLMADSSDTEGAK